MLNGAKSQGSETEEAGLAQAVDESPESETIGDNGDHRQAKINQEPARAHPSGSGKLAHRQR
jgi:hypothetical protein